MKKSAKHIFIGDIIAIFLCLAMAIYSIIIYKEYSANIALYYLLTMVFRIIVVLLQNAIVKKYDDPLVKFKKERILCRTVGVLLLAVDLAFLLLIFLGPVIKSVDIYQKYPWLLAVYGAYAIYKIVAGVYGFRKARKSVSPYRDIMNALNYIDSFVTLMSFIGFILKLTLGYPDDGIATTIYFYIFVIVMIMTLVITIKVIVSRKIPNSLK